MHFFKCQLEMHSLIKTQQKLMKEWIYELIFVRLRILGVQRYESLI